MIFVGAIALRYLSGKVEGFCNSTDIALLRRDLDVHDAIARRFVGRLSFYAQFVVLTRLRSLFAKTFTLWVPALLIISALYSIGLLISNFVHVIETKPSAAQSQSAIGTNSSAILDIPAHDATATAPKLLDKPSGN